jgi:hypothetical protein
MTFLSFCERVLFVQLTPAQRVLAAVAFDGVQPRDLTGADRDVARQLFGPVDEVPSEARAVLVAVCGARSGKSYVLGALYSLWRALTADLSSLAPGELAVALIVAPDLRLGRQVLRYALGAARGCRAIASLIVSETSDSFALARPDGATVSLETLPATRGGSAVRGRSLVSAVLDECAFFRDETAAVNDQDVFRAVAPRVMRGGLVVLCSTPWLEAGLLFTEFSANWGSPASALAVSAPTLLMRPDTATAALVARERQRDAANAEREFDARFVLGGAGLLFASDLLRPAIRQDLSGRLALPDGCRAAIGGDIGLVQDASAFVAVHSDESGFHLADVLEMRPRPGAPLKLSEVVQAGCEFAARHGQRSILVDHHVLEPAREHLPKGFRLVACDGGQAPKAERWLKARELFRAGQVTIPGEHARIAGQLGDVVARPMPGGGTSIILPRRSGTHLDAAAAFILSLWAAERAARKPVSTFQPPPTFVTPFESSVPFDGGGGEAYGTKGDSLALADWLRRTGQA